MKEMYYIVMRMKPNTTVAECREIQSKVGSFVWEELKLELSALRRDP